MTEFNNMRHELGGNILLEDLLAPVPLMDGDRLRKAAYRSHPIDSTNLLYTEPLVWLDEYGIAGQGYWSRPNAALPEPVHGFEPRLRLRRSVAETLHAINNLLEDDKFTELFGVPVELYAEDGVRTINSQKFLYETVFPEHIAARNPSWTPEQIAARRDQLIAAPAANALTSPTPHMTGGAIDVIIRYKQDTLGYVPDQKVELLREDGDTGDCCNPDYAEYSDRPEHIDEATWDIGRRNRRILYNLFTRFGMQVNPTEYWHWSYGDQMWAMFKDQPAAFYGCVTD